MIYWVFFLILGHHHNFLGMQHIMRSLKAVKTSKKYLNSLVTKILEPFFHSSF